MFDSAGDPVRPDLADAIDRCWDELRRPGTWWDANAKAEIISVGRAARSAASASPAIGALLPEAALDAARRIAAYPSSTTERWVRETCNSIGEPSYLELVGIVARVAAVDSFMGVLGCEPVAVGEPVKGEPTRTAPPDGIRRNHTWVAMAMPVPPFVLGAVPAAMAAMNDLSDALYMPMSAMGEPDWRRGDLHRTQVEVVAATVSHENECFY